MKLHSPLTINDRVYPKGTDVPWFSIYPFFLVHMLAFGASGFAMAYWATQPDATFLFMHGGLAITVYTIFYLTIFGIDEVKWLFINAALGIAGIYSQVAWILERFGKRIDDVPWYVNVIPFTYYVLYVFLIRQAFLDLFNARENLARRATVEKVYVAISIAICVFFYLPMWPGTQVEDSSMPAGHTRFEETFSRPYWFGFVAAREINTSKEVGTLWRSERRCCGSSASLLRNNRIFYKSCYNAILAHREDEALVVKCLWLMDVGAKKGQAEKLARYLVDNFAHHKNSVDDCVNCMPGDTVARVTLDLARYESDDSHSSKERSIGRIENLLDTRADEISYWVQAEIYEFLGQLYLESGLTQQRLDRYKRAHAELSRVKESNESLARRFDPVEKYYKAMLTAAEPIEVEKAK